MTARPPRGHRPQRGQDRAAQPCVCGHDKSVHFNTYAEYFCTMGCGCRRWVAREDANVSAD